MEGHRSGRITETLRSEIEEILNYELDDPRITSVAVTEVLLSPDGRKAHLRLRLSGTEEEQAGCLQAIEKAKSYVRHLVAGRIELFRVPDLHFDPDLPPEIASKAPHLLRRIHRGRPREDQKNPSE